MAKLELCPFCGFILLDTGCCGCDGKGNRTEVKAKEEKEPSRRKSKP